MRDSKNSPEDKAQLRKRHGRRAHAACVAGTSALAGVLIFSFMPVSALAAAPSGTSGISTQSASFGGSVSASSANTQTFDYTGSYSGVLVANGTSVSSSSETYSTTTADQVVALAENGGALSIVSDTLTKSGDDTNGDNCNFYGVNSILTAVGDASTVYVSDSTLTASSEGSNGIFSTDGAHVYANNDTITTTDGGNARGLDATYGGYIIANLMTISTEGDHCASIATDRGGGYISVTNSELATAGSGSPLLYSTGEIEVDNVSGTATGSQIAGMEGLNSIHILDSTLTSTNDARSGSDPIKDAVILYQSTSGDADTSTGSAADFQAQDSTLTSSISDGAFFYVTNTTANIVLDSTSLVNSGLSSGSVELLHASGNSNNWGTSGSNGATVTLTGIGQTLTGLVDADSISSVTLYLTDGTTWTGATASTNNTGDGTTATPSNVDVNVDASSTWVVTESCTVGDLNVASGGSVVDSSGNACTIVDANGNTLVSGSSTVVTVSGSYSGSATISGAGSIDMGDIDRSTFDAYYGTSTTFGSNTGSDTGSDTSTSTSTSDETSDSIQVYRLYNPYSGEHLYTTSSSEYSYLATLGWKQEGTAWYSPESGDTPVYRLYNPYSGDHLYTTSTDECDALEALGWKKEGVAFYSNDSDDVTVYRLFNPYETVGTHLYTTSSSEYQYLATLGWKQEGAAFYGISVS